MNALTEGGQDTRQRLIDSARALIYARSYSDVGVQAICEHANVKKGSFYHFFPSKKDLTLAVLDHLFIEFKTGLIGKAFADDIPPMQRFLRMAEMVYRFQKEVADSTGHILGCPFGNLSTELSSQEEEIRQKISEIFDRFQEITRQTLLEAVEAGEIGDIDIEATAEAMYAYLEGVMLMAKTRNDAEMIKLLAPAVADIRIPKNTN
jgi:TetR/AcrR family transcriptional repressor of nem operon